MVKIVFLAALAAASIGALWACAPHQSYLRQYQALHRGNPCVQCGEVLTEATCSNGFHNSDFSCSTPVVNYGLVTAGQCAEVSIVCLPDPTVVPAVSQSVMVVALMDNSDGRFGPEARVFAPISELGSGYASVIKPCDMQSLWMTESMDDFRLAQPLVVQCAHNAPGYVLPPVAQRYPLAPVNGPPAEAEVIHTGEVVEGAQVDSSNRKVINEHTEVVVVGTTLVPVWKERIVQNVIKELHKIPIQKKRIITTKNIEMPTHAEREVYHRIPATKIVPTYELRRNKELIRGTTVVPEVSEVEVTEILPELQEVLVVTEEPVQAPAAAVVEEHVQPAVESGGYEGPHEEVYPAVTEETTTVKAVDGYEAPVPTIVRTKPVSRVKSFKNGYKAPAPVVEERVRPAVQSNGYEGPREDVNPTITEGTTTVDAVDGYETPVPVDVRTGPGSPENSVDVEEPEPTSDVPVMEETEQPLQVDEEPTPDVPVVEETEQPLQVDEEPEPTVDTEVPPTVDTEVPPTVDTEVPPTVDTEIPPTSGTVLPVVEQETHVVEKKPLPAASTPAAKRS